MRSVFTTAVLGALVLVVACSKEDPPSGGAVTAAATLPHPYDTADLANGKKKFVQCSSCHTIKEGGANLTGPALYGMFGRQVGTVPEYKYSDAVKNADFVWDAEKLDQWLAKPKDFLPGTKMSFPGLKEEKDRVDLIAYLMTATQPKP